MFETYPDIKDGQPFPISYQAPLNSIFADPAFQACVERGIKVSLPEK
jgi:hypothetical protein